jgi:hypothetical protein
VAESVSALVSACCAAALDRFPLVAGMKSHLINKSIMLFLGFFAPVHDKMRKSEAQLTWCFPQTFYSWISTTTSSSCYRKNSDPQIRSTKEDSPQNIS